MIDLPSRGWSGVGVEEAERRSRRFLVKIFIVIEADTFWALFGRGVVVVLVCVSVLVVGGGVREGGAG